MILRAVTLAIIPEFELLDPAVRDYVRSAISDNTRRAYQSDFRHFIAWGGAIPATDRMIAKYLADHAAILSMATLARRLVTIGKAHTMQGLISPVNSELVRLTFRGVRHKHGRRQRQMTPVLRQDLLLMGGHLKDSLRDRRDRALLLVGFAGAFRRSELVPINFTDVEHVPEGIIITLRRTKTDQEGKGRRVGIPYARGLVCPVRALDSWISASSITEGPIFRSVDRHGNVGSGTLTGEAVALVVKRARCGCRPRSDAVCGPFVTSWNGDERSSLWCGVLENQRLNRPHVRRDAGPLHPRYQSVHWQLDRYRLFCGSALERASFATLMDGAQADLIFVDPPYNVRIEGHASGLGAIHHREFAMASGEMTEGQYTLFLAVALKNLAQFSADGSVHYVCMDWRHQLELLTAAREAYSELLNLCVWVKSNAGMGSLYRSQHELVYVFKNGTAPHRNNIQLGRYGRNRTNVWTYPGATSFGRHGEEGNLLTLHPTIKPAALIADAILDCSARGDIVLDAFLGSGSTLIAAERVGRACYGIELDPLYVDTAIRRWQKFTGAKAIHAVTGKSFDELADPEASHD